MNKMNEMNKTNKVLYKCLTKEELWQLRQDIPLCSIYYADYRNRFGIEEHASCDFFDGYAEYISELMTEDGYDGDNDFYELLTKYDTPENLEEWYWMFDENPLPIIEEEEEEDEDYDYEYYAAT